MSPDVPLPRVGHQFRPIPGYLPSRSTLLRRLDRRARLAALVAALEITGGIEAESFAAELVEMLTPQAGRHRKDAAIAAARLFALLPAQARSAAVCVARESLITAAEALSHDQPLGRRSLAAIAGATAAPSLGRSLPTLLLDADLIVVATAEQAINDIAAMAATASLADRAQWERVLVDAIAGFDRHRRRTVLLAGLRLLGTPAGLAGAADARSEWLTDSSHPASLAIRSLLRREQGPEIARAALVWLRVPAQAPACRDRLLSAGSPAEHDAILRHAHLLAHPARSRALAARNSARADADGPARTIDSATLEQLSADARRHIPRWIAVLPDERAPAEEHTALLAADPDPVVRLAAITAPGSKHSIRDLTDLVYDDNEGVARSAAIRMTRPRTGRRTAQEAALAASTITRLQRSPHAGVRAIAHAAHEDPHAPAARTARRLALRRDRAATLAELRDSILMGSTTSRVSWMGTCRTIGAAPDLERDLCDIADEFMSLRPADDAHTTSPGLILAATAVAALADCTGDRSSQLLLCATQVPDPRVASNAVEALARRARRTGAAPTALNRLIEFKDDAAHRVRATAALALLFAAAGGAGDAERTGADVLMKMLEDTRAPHRLAGLWLADRAAASAALRPQVLIEPVTRLRDDADPGVQDRAVRCRRRLGALLGAREILA